MMAFTIKKIVFGGFIFVFVSCLVACGSGSSDAADSDAGTSDQSADSHEQVIEELIDTKSEMAETLSTIKDKQSAETAVEQFLKLTLEMQAGIDKLASLDEAGEEQSLALKEKYQDQTDQTNKAIVEQLLRIMKLGPEVQQVLTSAINDYERKQKEARETIKFKYDINLF